MLGATVALLAIGFGPTIASAGAAAPPATDVMFVFDTSGSMGVVLQSAKEEIQTLMTQTGASLPNVAFGVANVEDYPGYNEGTLEPVFNKEGDEVSKLTEKEYEEYPEKPWRLDQSLTTEQPKVAEAIDNLKEGDGGDAPESYGRALWETDTNPQVGWRPGARHEIILIADEVPHTLNVDEGIPAEFWLENPFDTYEELPGKWGIPDTQLKEGEKLEFHEILRKLDSDEKPLAMVDFNNTSVNYIHYWEYWAAATGGQAVGVEEAGKELGTKLAEIVKESAEGVPPCPPGYERTATTPCVKKAAVAPTPAPTPVVRAPSSAPPGKGKTYVLEGGEIEEEYEFPEGGEAEDSGEVVDGAEAARFQAGTLLNQLGGNQAAFIAKKKSKKCKKGYVKKGKKCVNNAPLSYGSMKLTIPAAGKYKFKLKPSGKVLAALKQGKTLNVKTTLKFVPKGTTAPILTVTDVKVHLKPKAKHPKGKGKKGKK